MAILSEWLSGSYLVARWLLYVRVGRSQHLTTQRRERDTHTHKDVVTHLHRTTKHTSSLCTQTVRLRKHLVSDRHLWVTPTNNVKKQKILQDGNRMAPMPTQLLKTRSRQTTPHNCPSNRAGKALALESSKETSWFQLTSASLGGINMTKLSGKNPWRPSSFPSHQPSSSVSFRRLKCKITVSSARWDTWLHFQIGWHRGQHKHFTCFDLQSVIFVRCLKWPLWRLHYNGTCHPLYWVTSIMEEHSHSHVLLAGYVLLCFDLSGGIRREVQQVWRATPHSLKKTLKELQITVWPRIPWCT